MKLDPNHAMVVFSGGQDSTTCLGWALTRFDKVSTVSFNYGQTHALELEAANRVIKHFQSKTGKVIDHEFVFLGPDTFAGTSPLTNRVAQLDLYEDYEQMTSVVGDSVEKTFVPMRNAAFLMLAANRAVVAGASSLVTGVCQEDNANYPDCRDVFVRSSASTIAYALGVSDFKVHTPLMNMSKAQSIKFALSLHHTYSALAYSHTAYDGKYPPTGKDHASVLRAHGFEEANVPDPLVLRAWVDGLMPLPRTPNYQIDRLEWVEDYLDFMGS